jgi:tripartite-type tricarboxylate transporter receptor subunit TctC
MNRRLMLLLLILTGVCDAAPAQVKTFPQRPVRIIVPVPPGGSVDAVTRLIAEDSSISRASR